MAIETQREGPDLRSLNVTRIASIAITAAVLALSLVVVDGFPLNSDVAWFMSVGRRVLEGEQLYRDIIEVNPPLAVYLLMPAVILSDALGLSDAVALKVLMLSVAGVSIFSFIRIAEIRGAPRTAWWLILLALGVLVVPAGDFGQREHILVLLTLPFVALKWRRINASDVTTLQAIVTGAVAGLGFAIKPHFILIWLALELFDRIVGRDPARGRAWASPESIAVATVLAAYALFVVLVHPTYFSMVGWIAPLYGMFVGKSRGLRTLVYAYLSLPMLIVLIAMLLATRGGLKRKPTLLFLVFGGASLAAAVIQGKGWRYHSLPLLIATLLAWGTLLEANARVRVRGSSGQATRRASVVLGVLMVAAFLFAHGIATAIRLANDERAVTVLQADRLSRYGARSITVLGDRISDAFPLATDIGARSVSPFPSLWWIRARYGSGAPLSSLAVEDRHVAERQLSRMLVADFTATPPDLVLVDTLPHARFGDRAFPYVEYFSADSEFAEAWQPYERTGTMGRFTIWMRQEDSSDRMDVTEPQGNVGPR